MEGINRMALFVGLAALAFTGVFAPPVAVPNKVISSLRGGVRTDGPANKALEFQESMTARCEKITRIQPGSKISVVMVADPGIFSGSRENRYA